MLKLELYLIRIPRPQVSMSTIYQRHLIIFILYIYKLCLFILIFNVFNIFDKFSDDECLFPQVQKSLSSKIYKTEKKIKKIMQIAYLMHR